METTDETQKRTYEVRVDNKMPIYFQADEIKIVDGVICLFKTNENEQSIIVAAFSSAIVSVYDPANVDKERTQQANTPSFR